MSSSNLPPLPDILIDVPPTTKFKRGDVVRLNSGGPAMTVFSTTVDPIVAVLYEDGSVVISTYNEMCLTAQEATHYCPLPPPP